MPPASKGVGNGVNPNCRAEDPNNCPRCHTGKYAQGANNEQRQTAGGRATPSVSTNPPPRKSAEGHGSGGAKQFSPKDGAAYIESLIAAEKDPKKQAAMKKYWAEFSAKATVKSAIAKVNAAAAQGEASGAGAGTAGAATAEQKPAAEPTKPIPQDKEGRLGHVKSIFEKQVANLDKRRASGEIDDDKYYDLFEAAEAKYEKRCASINRKFDQAATPEGGAKPQDGGEAGGQKAAGSQKPAEPKFTGVTSEEQQKGCAEFATKLSDAMQKCGINSSVDEVVANPFGTSYIFGHAGMLSRRERDDLRAKLGMNKLQLRIVGEDKFSITIPNKHVADVSYSSMMEDKDFTSDLSTMNAPAVLGVGRDGKRVAVDLADMPHLLIGGSTGQGKSSVVNSILVGLMESKTPEDVELYLIDPKGTEFSAYKDMPHVQRLIAGNDVKGTTDTLDDCVAEMRNRNELFAKIKDVYGVEVKDLKGYRAFQKAHPDLKNLPTLKTRVLAIDEFANFAKDPEAKKAVTQRIALLNEQARSAGIHLIVSTQDPKLETVGDIKANLPARIAVKTADAQRSRNILDENGAEDLTGRGDMFLKTTDNGMTRIKGAFINDKAEPGMQSELGKRLAAIASKYPKPAKQTEGSASAEPPKPPPAGKQGTEGSGAPSAQKQQTPPPSAPPKTSDEFHYPNTKKPVDLSHLGFFRAMAAAIKEGAKGNRVTYNPAAYNRMGADRWKQHLASVKASGGTIDYSQHSLSKMYPIPSTANEYQKLQFRKWCDKFDAAVADPDPVKAQIVKKQYLGWIRDEGLAEPIDAGRRPGGKNPYLDALNAGGGK